MLKNINGYHSINAFVRAKMQTFDAMPRTFASLCTMMFSEADNVMFEESAGYRIVRTTYGEAYARTRAAAAALRARLNDLPPDAPVGLWMDNGPDWICAFWAILGAGFRPLLLNMRLDPAVLAGVMADMNVSAVVCGEDGCPLCGGYTDAAAVPFPSLPVDAPASDAAGDFGTEVLVMSSGTSAHVKVCAYSAEEFYWQISDSLVIIRECTQIKKHTDGELKLLTFLPFCHIFGLVAVYIWFAFFSRTFVRLNDMSPRTITNTIRRHRVTHIFAVPLFWNRVYDETLRAVRERGEKTEKKFQKGLRLAAKINDVPLLGAAFRRIAFREVRDDMFGGSIRFMISGGSEIRPEVLSLFNGIGYRLADGYGMTEIGITSVELSGKAKYLNACSVGRPFSSVEYRLNDEGELLVRGRTLARAVIEGGVRRERQADEWFNTRDLAEYRDGRWFILGRRDDVVIAPNGENLNPMLIEPYFDGLPGVREACLVGQREGQTVSPVLVLRTDPYVDADTLDAARASVRAILDAHGLTALIGRLYFTSVPLVDGTTEIKLNRRLIAARLSDGSLPECAPAASDGNDADTPLARRIREIFASSLSRSADEIGMGFDFFTDGGGSSLDYFAALAVMSEEFGISFPTDGGRSLSSVSEIYAYIKDTHHT